MVGIPYARAIVDEQGTGVVCPECGTVVRPDADASTEDAITKGAAAKYAEHYEQMHK